MPGKHKKAVRMTLLIFKVLVREKMSVPSELFLTGIRTVFELKILISVFSFHGLVFVNANIFKIKELQNYKCIFIKDFLIINGEEQIDSRCRNLFGIFILITVVKYSL